MVCCLVNVCQDKNYFYFHKQIKGVFKIKIEFLEVFSGDILATRRVAIKKPFTNTHKIELFYQSLYKQTILFKTEL